MSQSTLKSWNNILQSSLNPQKVLVMVGKAIRRFSDSKGTLSPSQYKAWLEQNSRPLVDYVHENFDYLNAETDRFCAGLKKHADAVLAKIPYDLGGGGGVPLLYALVRHNKPQTVVETGVAAGFSSASILAALQENGAGHLYSSDFPYFRIENAEKYIGVVVDESLQTRWSLFIKGDQINIPAILKDIKGEIDLFHYDSDKSYDGRNFVLSRVLPRMSKNGIIVVDDIQDNCHFHDWVKFHKDMKWSVFSYQGKYIGMAGHSDS